jgi:hypothetical protein
VRRDLGRLILDDRLDDQLPVVQRRQFLDHADPGHAGRDGRGVGLGHDHVDPGAGTHLGDAGTHLAEHVGESLNRGMRVIAQGRLKRLISTSNQGSAGVPGIDGSNAIVDWSHVVSAGDCPLTPT